VVSSIEIMSRTNFENLRVYKLSEELADEIWTIVIRWDAFANDTVGRQIVRAPTALAQISLKERVAIIFRTTGVL
jgi:hypothetical protein